MPLVVKLFRTAPGKNRPGSSSFSRSSTENRPRGTKFLKAMVGAPGIGPATICGLTIVTDSEVLSGRSPDSLASTHSDTESVCLTLYRGCGGISR
jgi:hypothetical protein